MSKLISTLVLLLLGTALAADRVRQQATQPVRISDDSGVNVATVDSYNALNVLAGGRYLTQTIPLAVDSQGQLIISQNVSASQIPYLQVFHRVSLAPSTTSTRTSTITTKTAIKEFHVGGRVACEGTLSKFVAANTRFTEGFNSSGAVAAWTNTGIGDSTLTSWSYSTAQFTEGTGSASFTFTKSGANNYPEITYRFPSPVDVTTWRTISASARVTVAAGGVQTRTIQIRLNSGTAVAIYQLAGTTTTPPFSIEQWNLISKEIANPDAFAGTGTFDPNSVNSISLRLVDGGNKTGTIWWDGVSISGEFQLIDKIYSANGSTVQLKVDPFYIFNVGDVLAVTIRNNGSTTSEVQVGTSGVQL